jgi:flagellar hook-associated protein 2
MSTTPLNLNSSTATSGAGIDVSSVVASILASEAGPENQAKASLASLGTEQTALSSLNVGLTALLSSVNALGDVTGAITAHIATSSRTDLITATAGSSAASGQHTIIVGNLATGSSYASAPLVGTVINSGSFQLQVGSSAAVPITVDSTDNTLSGLASNINAQNLGVTASVVTDANGSRLALHSNATGLPADLTISGDTTGLGFTKTATAVNAGLTVDGLSISSASNTVTGVLSGVTLNLLNASAGAPISLTVGSDTAGATQAVNDFVAAYNSIITSINQQFTYNPASGTAGPLASDGDLRGLQTQLLQEVTYSVSGNNGTTGLASIGVNLNNDGTLSVDSTKLADTLANHSTDFQNFFQAPSGQTGFAQKLSADLQNLTNPTQGLLNVAIAQNRTDQKAVQSTINDFEDRLVTRTAQLTTQYSQVDATLRAFPLLLAQINGELGSLPTASPLK